MQNRGKPQGRSADLVRDRRVANRQCAIVNRNRIRQSQSSIDNPLNGNCQFVEQSEFVNP
jgi:hypothetical protein